jgi:hypothetical protein
MNHLDFVNELSTTGVSIRSTTIENRERRIPIPSGFGKDEVVILKNNSANYEGGNHSVFARKTASQAIISKAIDFDTWKHSWHNEITPENYEKFQEIIQKKIIDRAKEIEELVAIYFHLNSKLSNREVVA